MKENKLNQFKEIYKNNLLTLNLFFYFTLFFLSFHFFSLFSFPQTKHNIKVSKFKNWYEFTFKI